MIDAKVKQLKGMETMMTSFPLPSLSSSTFQSCHTWFQDEVICTLGEFLEGSCS